MPRQQGMPTLENSEVMHEDVLVAVSSSLARSMPSALTWYADVSHEQMTSGPLAEIRAPWDWMLLTTLCFHS